MRYRIKARTQEIDGFREKRVRDRDIERRPTRTQEIEKRESEIEI